MLCLFPPYGPSSIGRNGQTGNEHAPTGALAAVGDGEEAKPETSELADDAQWF